MIKAYHRVSSDEAYEAILSIGSILPAAYRIDPDQAVEMCEKELGDIGFQTTEARRGVARLLDERVREVIELQERESVRSARAPATMLFCADLLAGDFMNVFLSPGGFTSASLARGWPLSGFGFDAEELVRRGAEYRPQDLLFSFRHAVAKTMRTGLGEQESYKAVKQELERQRHGTLYEDAALEALKVFDDPAHDPTSHKKYDWPSNAEVVWTGPLPLDLAVEVWGSGELLETRVA